jgi:hypothetical protein
MLEISIFYLIGSVVVLPGVTYYFTKIYYNKQINNLIEDYNDRETKNILEDIDETNIHDEQIMSPIQFTYTQKLELLEEHFKKIIKD